MQARELTARANFRQHGRHVIRVPSDRAAHEERVMAACALPGAEPLQGALADMLYACLPNPTRTRQLLTRPAVAQRLAPFVARAFMGMVASGRRLPIASSLATRYSVLATPSMDVPRRALLVGVDDSREIAARAVEAIRRGDVVAEEEFLSHCKGAADVLAFMLARRTLTREGLSLSAAWEDVSSVLQQEVQT